MTDLRDWAPVAGALGVGGLIGEMARRLSNWRRDQAEVAKLEAEISPEAQLHQRTVDLLKQLIESQSARIAEQSKAIEGMNSEVSRMALEIEDLRNHVDTLADELRKHNLAVPKRRPRAVSAITATG